MPLPRLPPQMSGNSNTSIPGTVLRARDSVMDPQIYRMNLRTTGTGVISAGVASTVAAVTFNILSNYTSWAALFQEYCIVGVRAKTSVIIPGTSGSGYMAVFLDEQSAAAPGLSDLDKNQLQIPLNVGSAPVPYYVIEWKLRDIFKAEWTNSATGSTVPAAVYVKYYASIAGTGTTTAVTGTYTTIYEVAIDFRGMK